MLQPIEHHRTINILGWGAALAILVNAIWVLSAHAQCAPTSLICMNLP